MEQREEDVVEQHKMQLIRLDDLKRRYALSSSADRSRGERPLYAEYGPAPDGGTAFAPGSLLLAGPSREPEALPACQPLSCQRDRS